MADYLGLVTSIDTAGSVLDKGRPATGYERTVVATLRLSIEQLSDAPRELLRLCACLAPEPIPLRLFTEHPDLLPPMLARTAARPLDWNDTVGELRRYSLATRVPVLSRGRTIGDGLQLHRLTLEVARMSLAKPEDLQTALVLLAAVLPDDPQDPTGWAAALPLLVHLLRVAKTPEAEVELAVNSLNRAADVAFYSSILWEAEVSPRARMQSALRV